jgi:hypothetical protein
MKNKFHTVLFAILASLAATHAPEAEAQSCEAYFPFDGSLADASGNGFDGRMIGQDGAAATPRFVEGRSGQALALDGTMAMRAFVDLNYESCPQVSFTAWVRFDGPVLRENRVILATGGSGPGLRAVGSVLVLNGTANGLWVRDAVRADSGWMFVAGVYDYADNTYALHWRNRSVEGTLSQHRRPPEDAVWVGAMDDRLTYAASNIVIDELRIFESVLGAEELRAMARDAPAAIAEGRRPAAGTLLPGDQYDPARLPGDQYDPARLPGDQYDSSQPGTGSVEEPAGLASDSERLRQRIEGNRPIELGSESESTSESREIVTTDVRDSLQERVEQRRPMEFGYESDEEAVAAAEAAAERRAQEEVEAEATVAAGATGEAPASLPRPSGPPRFSAIAGTSGDGQTIVDLENEFLHFIQWFDKADAPCFIVLSALSGGDIKMWDGCRSQSSSTGHVTVLLPSNVISAIEVCQRDDNQVVKGIRAVGTAVNLDGTLVYVPAVTDQTRPDCDTWTPRVLCPQDHVGTGIVVHSRERRLGDGRVIIGLQLVCRVVTVQGG